jgi:type VI protein secretion system component VasF
MALIDHCEKLLAYLCRLNRLGRTRAASYPDAGEVRNEIMAMLADIKAKATPGVYNPAVEQALWATADWMVKGSRLPWAEAAWNKRGFDPHNDRFDLDQVFWDNLDATLAEPKSSGRDERLEVFAACIGIGYVGKYVFEREKERAEALGREMRRIWAQVKDRQEVDERGRITPATYDFTIDEDLRPPRVPGTVRYAVLLAVMLVGLIIAQVLLFKHAKKDLADSVNAINSDIEKEHKSEKSASAAWPTAGEGARP